MLEKTLYDPDGTELGGKMNGLGLLPVRTVFRRRKTLCRVSGTVRQLYGVFSALSGAPFTEYEIHAGRTKLGHGAEPFAEMDGARLDGAVSGNVMGSYVHGLFDGELGARLLQLLLLRKGLDAEADALTFSDSAAYRERQFDLLADALRAHLDMERVYRILNREDA